MKGKLLQIKVRRRPPRRMTDQPKKRKRGHQPGTPKVAGRKPTGIKKDEARTEVLSGKVSRTASLRWEQFLRGQGKKFGAWAEEFAKSLPPHPEE